MDEREFELVNIIGAKLGSNQRDLSRLLDLSLGMTNMLIRRLLAKGYIRIQQLDKKKVAYILTPKGVAEKMQQSVKYTLKTIHSISLLKKNISAMLEEVSAEGTRKFYILGGSDLAGLVEMILVEKFNSTCEIVKINDVTADCKDGAVLICRENVTTDAAGGIRTVNVIEELARDGELLGHVLAAGAVR